MKMSPRNIASVAYEAQQATLTQLGGTVGLPWEQATAATKGVAYARVLQIKDSLAASGVVPGTLGTSVGTAGLSVGANPKISVAAKAGDRLCTFAADTLTGSANPGDTLVLTACWSLVTSGSIQTSGAANLVGNSTVLLKGTSTMTGSIAAGETFTISAQAYYATAPATASGNTCRVPVTPALQAGYSDATAVTVGNPTITVDTFATAAANSVNLLLRAPAPTIPINTVVVSYTAIAITVNQAQFVFDQVVLSCLDSHGGDG